MTAGATVWPAPFVDTRGNRRPGLVIKVYLPGQGPLPDGDGSLEEAQLYTDDALTVPRDQTTNPVTTNGDGNEVEIKAAPGRYDAYVDGETIPLVVVPDPAYASSSLAAEAAARASADAAEAAARAAAIAAVTTLIDGGTP